MDIGSRRVNTGTPATKFCPTHENENVIALCYPFVLIAYKYFDLTLMVILWNR
jgi:hypothetical protein